MKTPWYESSPGATVALLATKIFVKMDLYTLTLQGGLTLRYATGQVDVSVPGGYYWNANTVPFGLKSGTSTGMAHFKVGTDVDTWQIALMPRTTNLGGVTYPDKIGSVPWVQAVRAGMLDGATFQVDRAIFAAWPTGAPSSITPVGVVTVFAGTVAAVDFDHAAVIINAQSMLQLLTQQTPRNVFQAGCRHTLFDAGCGLAAASYAVNSAALAGSTQSVLNTAAVAGGSGTFALGRIKMTSGLNSGFQRGIRSHIAGTSVKVIVPFPFVISTGDTFTLYPGCDKSTTQCTAFSNLANYGGEPATPIPETAI